MRDRRDKRFRFSVDHDLLLLQEVVRINPYEHKCKGKDVHEKFVSINCINLLGSSKATCTVRGVKEHIDHLVKCCMEEKFICLKKAGNASKLAEKMRLLQAAKELKEETWGKKAKLKEKSRSTEEIGIDKACQTFEGLKKKNKTNSLHTSTKVKIEDTSSSDSTDIYKPDPSILPGPDVSSLKCETSFSAVDSCETSFEAFQNIESSSTVPRIESSSTASQNIESSSRTTQNIESSRTNINFESSSAVLSCYKSSSVASNKSKTVFELLNRPKTSCENQNNFKHLYSVVLILHLDSPQFFLILLQTALNLHLMHQITLRLLLKY